MKLLSLTSRFRKSAKGDEIPKIPRSINLRNINYMGKFRLKKILYNYILCQYGKEMFIDFAAAVQACETAEQFYIKQEEHKKSKMGSFYLYTNGYPAVNDWIICYHNKYYFTVDTCCGIERIRVAIRDCWSDGVLHSNTIFTWYDKNFVPIPSETKLFGDIAPGTDLFNEIKPFENGCTTYNGITCSDIYCYDLGGNP